MSIVVPRRLHSQFPENLLDIQPGQQNTQGAVSQCSAVASLSNIYSLSQQPAGAAELGSLCIATDYSDMLLAMYQHHILQLYYVLHMNSIVSSCIVLPILT